MAQIRTLALKDFTGGLNLRADQFQLGLNESPDILNMDIDPRGGVKLRHGASIWQGPPANIGTNEDIGSMGAFYDSDGSSHVIVQTQKSTGEYMLAQYGESVGTTTYITGTTQWTVGDVCNFVQFKDAVYVQNGTNAPVKWTGAATSYLTQTFIADFETSTDGNMPIAKRMAAHNGYMWVANTYESGTSYPNRVRFSHPNQPERWRSDDWIDIDPGVDGDSIQALVPFADHLLVFKKRSVYAIYGFDADSFNMQNVTRELGVVGPQALCASPQGVFFFSERAGVMLYDGSSIRWKFEPLVPALDEGDIDITALDTITACWTDNRAWFSVPWVKVGDPTNRVFVHDPSLGKEGSWTAYVFPWTLGAMLSWGEPGTQMSLAAVGNMVASLVEFGQPYDVTSEVGDDPQVAAHIDSTYVTPWVDAGEIAVRKRWRRPWFVISGDTPYLLSVQVFRDYDRTSRSKLFTVPISAAGDPALVGRWGTGEWGTMLWYSGETDNSIRRGSSLGLGRSVQLEFTGPTEDAIWGLDNITFTYIPRKLR